MLSYSQIPEDKRNIDLLNGHEISLTAYRAYFILELLLISPHSKDDILAQLKSNKFLCKTGHKDSIVNSINTLRAAGCEIERPKPSNNFKYTLVSHPFKIDISPSHVDILNFLRKSLYAQEDYKIIMKLNKCYSLIAQIASNKIIGEELETSNYFKKINLSVLEKLLEYCKDKAVVTIMYKSPVHGEEAIKVKCEKVFFENKRLYLWSWSYKYNSSSYHRVDKIIDVIRPELDTTCRIMEMKATYKIKGDSIKTFVPLLDERIVLRTKEELVVEAPIVSSFNFYQRILGFASDCEILTPKELRDGFVEKIDEMLKASGDFE